MQMDSITGLLTRRQPKIHEHTWKKSRDLPLYIMLLPGLIALILFSFYPMHGIVIAFQNYKPLLGIGKSAFIGFGQFERMFTLPDAGQVFLNTLFIATGKIVLGQVASLLLALLLHEVIVRWFKGAIQSLTYLLYFLSWVVLGGILLDILAADGLVNQSLQAIGLPIIPFLSNADVFPWTLILTDVWKGFGFGAIIYLAALTAIDPSLYEAAAVDGSNRLHRLWYITLPAIMPTIALIACLKLADILNAGFDQVLFLQNPQVYSTGDIIDTFVYRVGLINYQYSFATAVGLLRSVISFILISLSFYLAKRFANYQIF